MRGRTYRMSYAASLTHTPAHPERTAKRHAGSDGTMDFDVEYRVWPNAASLDATIRMQEQREPHRGDWRRIR